MSRPDLGWDGADSGGVRILVIPGLAPGASAFALPLRVSVPLLKTLDQMLANGCFDLFTTEQE